MYVRAVTIRKLAAWLMLATSVMVGVMLYIMYVYKLGVAPLNWNTRYWSSIVVSGRQRSLVQSVGDRIMVWGGGGIREHLSMRLSRASNSPVKVV